MHGVRNSPWNPILFALPRKIQIWEWGRERFWEEKDWWNPITNLCCIFLLCLMLLSLCVPLFFFLLSMSLLCVCTCSLFVFLPSFSFFFLCVPLSIYREIPKKLFHYFSLNWSIHRVVFVSFSSITPNFMFSRDPLLSF